MTAPARPALSGPGSSAAAWRVYATTVSDMGGWDDMSRDEIIALLQEGGYLDSEGNPVTPPKAIANDTPLVDTPVETESSNAAGSTSQPSTSDSSREPEQAPEQASERGLVDEPCKICYPGGWPTKQPGSSASCHHGLTIRQGETVEITREQAIAMGFIRDGE